MFLTWRHASFIRVDFYLVKVNYTHVAPADPVSTRSESETVRHTDSITSIIIKAYISVSTYRFTYVRRRHTPETAHFCFIRGEKCLFCLLQ